VFEFLQIQFGIGSKTSAFGPFTQPGSPAQTLIPEYGVFDRLQSANHILLTERVINEDNHLTATEYVFIPTSQTGHPSVPGFGLSKKAFVIVIGPWNMRMVIACKQAFPKPPCIVHEIDHERFVVFVGLSFLYPFQQMFQMKLNRLASFIDMWIQDFGNMVNGLRPALYSLVLILKIIKLTEYSDQAFQQ